MTTPHGTPRRTGHHAARDTTPHGTPRLVISLAPHLIPFSRFHARMRSDSHSLSGYSLLEKE